MTHDKKIKALPEAMERATSSAFRKAFCVALTGRPIPQEIAEINAEEFSMTEEQENELICEKVLGWKCLTPDGMAKVWKVSDDVGSGWRTEETPTFRTWAEAGLILDALKSPYCIVSIRFAANEGYCAINLVSSDAKPLPLAVRAAALEYARGMK